MRHHLLTCLATGILLGIVGLAPVGAQDTQRFVISNAPGNVTPHLDLRDAVTLAGGRIYVEVDRPQVDGNFVAAELDPAEAQALRDNRPDLRLELDVVLRPAAGGAGAWSPDRIDQRIGQDGAYLPPVSGECERAPFVYICDTGVMAAHDEFASAGSRLALAGSYIPATLAPFRTLFTAWQDPWDHGTGVASCALGETTGSGRCRANLISAVCYPDPGALPGGTFASYGADVIYWALNEHTLRTLDDDPFNDASVLIFASSTTTGPSGILDLAIQRAYLGGMTVVVSAGNQNIDVLNASPAGAVSGVHGDITLTVAASTPADLRWAGSNFGPNVELFAPGEQVLCASSTGRAICLARNGTSLSAGYVGGAATRILARNPWATPSEVTKLLTDLADPEFGPSGPFGGGANAVSALLYVHPAAVPCVPMDFLGWADQVSLQPVAVGEDPDCDCLPNALEFFMGLDPGKHDPWQNHPYGTVGNGGGGVKFHFRKANYICDRDLWAVEYSTDLHNWTEVAEGQIVADESAECLDIATWMVATIIPESDRIYVRLAVTGL